jgi:hypothetical protein
VKVGQFVLSDNCRFVASIAQHSRERNTLPDAIHPEPIHMEGGNYTADVLHHTNAEPFWYYVIHRKDSNGVIDRVKFNTYKQAIARAREVLARLNQAA